jgi:hypothetical protein
VSNLRQLPARIDALSVQISQLREDVSARFSTTEKALREEIVAGDERILAQVRVLHEDLVSRLALIQEGQPRPRSHKP